jgi:hypothetical protein
MVECIGKNRKNMQLLKKEDTFFFLKKKNKHNKCLIYGKNAKIALPKYYFLGFPKSYVVQRKQTVNIKKYIPSDQKGLFELAIYLRAFCYSAVCNTATGYIFRQIFDVKSTATEL